MQPPSRRNLLTAAAAAIAASPALAAAQGRPAPGGNVPVFASRALAAQQRVGVDILALWCAGYAQEGDGGQAMYARAAADPGHAGAFRSTDGAWWELAENALNPFMFGARAEGRNDDSGAIQAMFDMAGIKRRAWPMQFLGARYYLAKGVRLPVVPVMVALDIDGGGGQIWTDQPIVMMSRIPADQDDAMHAINGAPFEIHNLGFLGSGVAGQVGLHLGATYCNVVRNCFFSRLDYGSIGSFCLASAWRDLLYFGCAKRAAVVQTGAGYDAGAVWPGAAETNSASNVSVFENCRVFGHPDQISAYGIFGSDAVRVNGCISEGHGANIDVHFDFQASPTVKQFHIDTFHCESPPARVNFKIRADGKVTIERVIRSYPAALLDMSGSLACEVIVRGLAWLGEFPVATGKGPNPKGRWFFHSGGKGFEGADEGISSSGTTYRFEDCAEGAWKHLSNPAHWEAGKLPDMLYIRGCLGANGGMHEWSTSHITFGTPVTFEGEGRFAGMRAGTVNPKTAMVPAQSSVDERFEVPGIDPYFHSVTLNPQEGSFAPPPGIMWNSFAEGDGMTLRLTNVTGKAIALRPGGAWTYRAARRG